jgi:hypothetical protein
VGLTPLSFRPRLTNPQQQRSAHPVVAVVHEALSVHMEHAGAAPPLGLVQLRNLDLLGVQDVPLELAAVDVGLAGEYRAHVLLVVADFELIGGDYRNPRQRGVNRIELLVLLLGVQLKLGELGLAVAYEVLTFHMKYTRPPSPLGLVQLRSLDLLGLEWKDL